ncbi:MAG: metallophosphoesterase [Acidimicrobiales bacterium]
MIGTIPANHHLSFSSQKNGHRVGLGRRRKHDWFRLVHGCFDRRDTTCRGTCKTPWQPNRLTESPRTRECGESAKHCGNNQRETTKLTVTQFSDTHFSLPGNRSHHGFGYDTDAAWEAASTLAFRDVVTDLTVVTGDLADHGRPDEYEVAFRHLNEIPNPVNILTGNHDFHAPFQADLAKAPITMDRAQQHGGWQFIFADSNFEGREKAADGSLIDTENRIETNGRLGPDEVEWITELANESAVEHAWLWMHHPPAMSGDTEVFANQAFTDEVGQLLRACPKIRGIGAGHVHTDLVTSLQDRPIILCPALTINVDTAAWTLLPPGYRTYEFAVDGSVESECHFVEDPRWPRNKVPQSVVDYYRAAQ